MWRNAGRINPAPTPPSGSAQRGGLVGTRPPCRDAGMPGGRRAPCRSLLALPRRLRSPSLLRGQTNAFTQLRPALPFSSAHLCENLALVGPLGAPSNPVALPAH